MSEKERMLKQGHSLNFSQGYEDGCSTGHGEAGMFSAFKKNPRLSKISSDYRKGWNDGRIFCGNQSRSNLQMSLHQNAMMYNMQYK